MILKNFINLFSVLNVLLFIVYLYIVNNFLIELNIRRKFVFFILNLFIIIGIGFYYNLDGIVLLFFMSELTVILIFITLYSQLYSHNNTKEVNNKTALFLIIILLLNFQYYEIKLISYSNYYSFYNIVLNDFYYIYNCYFEKQILMTLFTIFIITLYSIFFILLFYSLKYKTQLEGSKKKYIILLRKQNILHQNNYNTNIRLFKNKS